MNQDLHDAMVRLAYAEKEGRSSLTGGNNEHYCLLELVDAARTARHAYMRPPPAGADDLRTRPVTRTE